MKKIIFSLGTSSMIVAPIATVISCGHTLSTPAKIKQDSQLVNAFSKSNVLHLFYNKVNKSVYGSNYEKEAKQMFRFIVANKLHSEPGYYSSLYLKLIRFTSLKLNTPTPDWNDATAYQKIYDDVIKKELSLQDELELDELLAIKAYLTKANSKAIDKISQKDFSLKNTQPEFFIDRKNPNYFMVKYLLQQKVAIAYQAMLSKPEIIHGYIGSTLKADNATFNKLNAEDSAASKIMSVVPTELNLTKNAADLSGFKGIISAVGITPSPKTAKDFLFSLSDLKSITKDADAFKEGFVDVKTGELKPAGKLDIKIEKNIYSWYAMLIKPLFVPDKKASNIQGYFTLPSIMDSDFIDKLLVLKGSRSFNINARKYFVADGFGIESDNKSFKSMINELYISYKK